MTTRKPLIAVTSPEKGGQSGWLFARYSLWRAGARAVRVRPSETPDIDTFDGLVVGGGDHISPALYNGEIMPEVRLDAARDSLERNLIDKAMHRDMPCLGICRGAQMINICRGGSLFQDITKIRTGIKARRTPLPRKRVELSRASRLLSIMGHLSFRVNSLHNQSVDRPGTGLTIAAKDRDDIVQAIEDPDVRFLIGVQWHPEYLVFNRVQHRLFKALVKAACL